MMYHQTNINLADAGSITLFNVQYYLFGEKGEFFSLNKYQSILSIPTYGYLHKNRDISNLILNFGMQKRYFMDFYDVPLFCQIQSRIDSLLVVIDKIFVVLLAWILLAERR